MGWKLRISVGNHPATHKQIYYAFLNSTPCDYFLTMYFFSISLSTKDENIKYYLGGGLGALSPISQIIRIFDSAPQLPKIKSLLPGYLSSPKPLWGWSGRCGAHPRNHFTTRNKRIIHVTHIIIFLNWIPREEWSLTYMLHVFWANYDSCWHCQYLRVYSNAPVVTARLTTN